MLSLFTSFFITLQLLLLFIQNISLTNGYLPYLEDVGNIQPNYRLFPGCKITTSFPGISMAA